MPLDYQQILTEMNHPRRRQGSSLAKKFAYFLLFLILVGGVYGAWRFGYVELAGGKVHSLYGTVKGWIAPAPDDDAPTPVDVAVVAADNEPAGSQTGGFSLPVPAPTSALNTDDKNSPTPRFSPDLAKANALLGSAETSGGISGLSPAPAQARPTKPENAPPRPAPAEPSRQPVPAASVVATPALSEAREQLKHIDQLLASDPAEALRRAEELLTSRNLKPDEAAEGGYRLGYAARLLKDEEKAEKSWRETAEKWPDTRGGRYSALAVADTLHRRYATTRPNAARWDDIQILYSQVLGKDDAPFLPEDVKARIKKNLSSINDAVFFGTAPTALAQYHKVEEGELLGGIARIYRVDYESLARVNGINPNRIRAGMDLKVVTGDVGIVVRKNEKDPTRGPTLTWFINGRWVREYPVCVGDGIKTPAGTYQLTSKERDPSWTNPANGQLLANDHPENILGSRWMAMKGMNTSGLGIHGTTIPDSIPGYDSAGCIRLHNRDVEELFSFARIGATVTVLE
ncbi:MAG: L,D-transpeptidase family protein [Planctomycetota bacterium]|jgi:lipoprotein-anchoring transpeptidase ErfK/SrfK|nr:L,D-transpeptidase family protein [Planctomycetota bacterium]